MIRMLLPCFLILSAAGAAGAQKGPLPTDKAAAAMTVPEGFRVNLFAGEPDLVRPIAMTVDDRGRLWVVESHSYPAWIEEAKTKKYAKGKDRVLIFEDTTGKGT